MGLSVDKRALKILFSTYWSDKGWKKTFATTPEDFAYAKSVGVMFEPRRINHATGLEWAINAKAALSPKHVTDGFLASLSNRRLELRSALGSYAVARHLPNHEYVPGRFPAICSVCGEFENPKNNDINVLNFERFKWGGVRHRKPFYIGFDLEQFALIPPQIPSGADRAILRQILGAAQSLPGSAKLSDLEKSIAPLFPSNGGERRNLIGILGYCGILRDRSRPSFFETYPHMPQRQDTPWYKDDWPYPVCWWNGSHGVSEDAVAYWFGDL